MSAAVSIAAVVIPVWHDSRSTQELSDAPRPARLSSLASQRPRLTVRGRGDLSLRGERHGGLLRVDCAQLHKRDAR